MAKGFRQIRKLATKILRKLGNGNKLHIQPIVILERPNDNDASNNNQQSNEEEICNLRPINKEQTREQFQIVNGFNYEEGPELYYGLEQIHDEEPLEYLISTPELVSEDSDKESNEIIEINNSNNNSDNWGSTPEEITIDNWETIPEVSEIITWGSNPELDELNNWYPWRSNNTNLETIHEITIINEPLEITNNNEQESKPKQFQPITFLHYKRKPLPCGCNKGQLQDASMDHMSRNHCTRKKNYHCCKCYRPLAKDEVYEGQKEHYQLCRSCDRNENFDITNEPWYHQPCQVCEKPIEQRENIGWNNDCCSTECKYAYLAVLSAQNFEHVPTRVYHYLNTGRGQYHNVDENEVLEKARNFHIKLYGEPEARQYDTRPFNNMETWNEARIRAYEEAQEAIDYLWGNTQIYLQDNQVEEDYIRNLNESFEANREAAIAKLPTMLDLTADHRLKLVKFNLCHHCLMPYHNDDLVLTNNKNYLCIKTEMNQHPCYIDPITNEIENIVEEAQEICNEDFGKEVLRQAANENQYCKCDMKTFLTEKQKNRYHRRICRDERKKFSPMETL